MQSIRIYDLSEQHSAWEAAATKGECEAIIDEGRRAMDAWLAENKPFVIMCPPTYYSVDKGSENSDEVAGNGFVKAGYDAYFSDPEGNARVMQEEWQTFHDVVQQKGAEVILMPPESGLPDLVFVADHSVSCVKYTYKNEKLSQQKAVTMISKLAHPNRGDEMRVFAGFLGSLKNNLKIRNLVIQREFYEAQSYMEGAGDNVVDPYRGIIISGYGLRNAKPSLEMLQQKTGLPVYGIPCKTPFFHVDTFFAALPDGYVLYAPEVMHPESVVALEHALFKGHDELKQKYAIIVSKEDAYRFACNAVIIGKSVIMQECSLALKQALQAKGIDVTYLTARIANYAGGGLHCMSNVFNQPVFV